MATEDDVPRRGSGKHALGDASQGGLVHLAAECGTDEPEIDLYTSPDLHECRLVGNDEERRFLGGVFWRTSFPEAEFMLSNQPMEGLTHDVEVAGIKALLLARGAHLHHERVVSDLNEKLSTMKKKKKDLKASNKTLLKRVSELEAKVEEDKKIVLEAAGKDVEIKRLEKAREEAVALAEGRAAEMEKYWMWFP